VGYFESNHFESAANEIERLINPHYFETLFAIAQNFPCGRNGSADDITCISITPMDWAGYRKENILLEMISEF
jgi:hypothetical protein